MTSAEHLVGTNALGEFRLDRVAYEDGAVAVFAARSVVDGGDYAVVVAKSVLVETSASALAEAVTRASQHAIGQRGLSALLSVRTVDVEGTPRVAAVRRGEPGRPVTEVLAAPRPLAEIVEALSPVVSTLEALHDQGVAHGAVSTATITWRDDRLTVDWFGLAMACEVASGPRGARALLEPAWCPPEVSGVSLPGPYSDTWALAKLALTLLVGDAEAQRGLAALGLPGAVEDALRLALAESPSSRPTPAAFLDGLARASRAGPSAAVGGAHAPELRPSHGVAQILGGPPEPDPDAAGPPSQPPPSAVSRGRGTRTVAIGLAATLGVLALVTAGALVWSLSVRPAPGTPRKPAPSASATTAPAPPTVSVVPAPRATAALDLSPPPPSGPATYPKDADALLPVAADAAVRGSRDALVTLVVAGAFTCEFTARELALIPALEAQFGADLRVVFLQAEELSDPSEAAAALAALAIREKAGAAAFWRFVSLTAGKKLDPGRLEELGIEAGAPAGVVTTAIEGRAGAARLARDVEIAARLGVKGTPTLFVNGIRLDGFRSYVTLATLLADERGRTAKAKTRGVPAAELYAARVLANITTSEGEKRYGK